MLRFYQTTWCAPYETRYGSSLALFCLFFFMSFCILLSSSLWLIMANNGDHDRAGALTVTKHADGRRSTRKAGVVNAHRPIERARNWKVSVQKTNNNKNTVPMLEKPSTHKHTHTYRRRSERADEFTEKCSKTQCNPPTLSFNPRHRCSVLFDWNNSPELPVCLQFRWAPFPPLSRGEGGGICFYDDGDDFFIFPISFNFQPPAPLQTRYASGEKQWDAQKRALPFQCNPQRSGRGHGGESGLCLCHDDIGILFSRLHGRPVGGGDDDDGSGSTGWCVLCGRTFIVIWGWQGEKKNKKPLHVLLRYWKMYSYLGKNVEHFLGILFAISLTLHRMQKRGSNWLRIESKHLRNDCKTSG